MRISTRFQWIYFSFCHLYACRLLFFLQQYRHCRCTYWISSVVCQQILMLFLILFLGASHCGCLSFEKSNNIKFPLITIILNKISISGQNAGVLAEIQPIIIIQSEDSRTHLIVISFFIAFVARFFFKTEKMFSPWFVRFFSFCSLFFWLDSNQLQMTKRLFFVLDPQISKINVILISWMAYA